MSYIHRFEVGGSSVVLVLIQPRVSARGRVHPLNLSVGQNDAGVTRQLPTANYLWSYSSPWWPLGINTIASPREKKKVQMLTNDFEIKEANVCAYV